MHSLTCYALPLIISRISVISQYERHLPGTISCFHDKHSGKYCHVVASLYYIRIRTPSCVNFARSVLSSFRVLYLLISLIFLYSVTPNNSPLSDLASVSWFPRSPQSLVMRFAVLSSLLFVYIVWSLAYVALMSLLFLSICCSYAFVIHDV